jgi:hypothetical protein
MPSDDNFAADVHHILSRGWEVVGQSRLLQGRSAAADGKEEQVGGGGGCRGRC